jgi:TRAP-type transport system small permease protein
LAGNVGTKKAVGFMSEGPKTSSLLGSAISHIEKFCFSLSLFSTVAMMLLISIDAVVRYFLNHPITGTYEITEEYLMVALVFLALSNTYTHGGHVRVTLFLRFIPSSVKLPVNILFALLGTAFFALLTYGGWNIFIRAVHEREFSDGLLQYPLAPAYFLIPLGSGLLCIRLIQDIVRMIRTKTFQEETEEIP